MFVTAACGAANSTDSPSRTPDAATVAAASGHATQPNPSHRRPVRLSLPLAGIRVGIDPGHNGGNAQDPSYINRLVWNGREQEACDTTGTETDGGYPEWRFTFAIAKALRRDLQSLGAVVVMTHSNDHGVGPCVNTRAHILNHARVDVAVDIHADGGPPDGRGFAVLEPVADGPNDDVIHASRRFGATVRSEFERTTKMPVSTYDGTGGITRRDDLAGLNLTTVPKVLVGCGNMRNATDAALLRSPHFQRRAARAFQRAIRDFVHR